MEQTNLTPKETDYAVLMVERQAGLMGVWAAFFIPTSVFIIGFLQKMGASAWHIGILSSLGIFFQAAVLLGSYIFEKYGKPRDIIVRLTLVAVIVRFFIALVPFLFLSLSSDVKISIVLFILFTSVGINVIGSAPWIPWLSSIVSTENWGKFWAKQNMIIICGGVLTTLIATKILDIFYSNITFLLLFAIGTVFGLAAVKVTAKIPQSNIQPERIDFLKLITLPFKSRLFKNFAIYASFFSFARSITLGFGILYMLDILKLSYFQIGIYSTMGAIVSVFAFGFWGHWVDVFGSKPVLSIATVLLGISSFLWLFSTENFTFIVPFIFLLDAISAPAHGIAFFKFQISSSPAMKRSIYISAMTVMVSICGGFAPLLGGVIAQILKDWSFSIKFWTVYNLHILFAVSSVLTFLTMFGLKLVEEANKYRAKDVIKTIFTEEGRHVVKAQIHLVIRGFGIIG